MLLIFQGFSPFVVSRELVERSNHEQDICKSLIEIKENEIGLIESVDGSSIPAGRIFAKVATGHNSFQSGEDFIKNGGQKGPQTEILPPGVYRIHPNVFKITKAAAVVIAKGQVGVVTAQDGAPIPMGRLLAQSVPGHSNYET